MAWTWAQWEVWVIWIQCLALWVEWVDPWGQWDLPVQCMAPVQHRVRNQCPLSQQEKSTRQTNQWYSTHRTPMHHPFTLVEFATKKCTTTIRLFSVNLDVIFGFTGKIWGTMSKSPMPPVTYILLFSLQDLHWTHWGSLPPTNGRSLRRVGMWQMPAVQEHPTGEVQAVETGACWAAPRTHTQQLNFQYYPSQCPDPAPHNSLSCPDSILSHTFLSNKFLSPTFRSVIYKLNFVY